MKIGIGIPCYRDVPGEILEDYMRFAFHIGRRMPEHDFFLAIKTKAEQFRARNLIVDNLRQVGCDYMLFLDDDHVIDWDGTSGPSSRYDFLKTLVKHMEDNPIIGVVGALYFQRGGRCAPVLMKEGYDGGFYWMRDDEIVHGLQEVAVQGGGCMLIRMSIFDKIKPPFFEPEHSMGTDLQISTKARQAGFKVFCDTSIVLGHVLNQREVVTPANRHRISMQNARRHSQPNEGIELSWKVKSALNLFEMDVEEYLDKTPGEVINMAERYNAAELDAYKAKNDLPGYYATRGKEQLARQYWYHTTKQVPLEEIEIWHTMINTSVPAYGLDFGCGSAPCTFDFVMSGHRLDFIDVPGAGGYEFLKWRAKKRGVEDRCGWDWGGPYDYVFMLDSIEHLQDWESVMTEVCDRLKPTGALITNYWRNADYLNPEHINMNKEAVKNFLISKNIYPLNELLWVKKDLGFMDRKGEQDGNSEKNCVSGERLEAGSRCIQAV